eukprot:Nk52_evm44s248 gene=Nk52_evmTU44s248
MGIRKVARGSTLGYVFLFVSFLSSVDSLRDYGFLSNELLTGARWCVHINDAKGALCPSPVTMSSINKILEGSAGPDATKALYSSVQEEAEGERVCNALKASGSEWIHCSTGSMGTEDCNEMGKGHGVTLAAPKCPDDPNKFCGLAYLTKVPYKAQGERQYRVLHSEYDRSVLVAGLSIWNFDLNKCEEEHEKRDMHINNYFLKQDKNEVVVPSFADYDAKRQEKAAKEQELAKLNSDMLMLDTLFDTLKKKEVDLSSLYYEESYYLQRNASIGQKEFWKTQMKQKLHALTMPLGEEREKLLGKIFEESQSQKLRFSDKTKHPFYTEAPSSTPLE